MVFVSSNKKTSRNNFEEDESEEDEYEESQSNPRKQEVIPATDFEYSKICGSNKTNGFRFKNSLVG